MATRKSSSSDTFDSASSKPSPKRTRRKENKLEYYLPEEDTVKALSKRDLNSYYHTDTHPLIAIDKGTHRGLEILQAFTGQDVPKRRFSREIENILPIKWNKDEARYHPTKRFERSWETKNPDRTYWKKPTIQKQKSASESDARRPLTPTAPVLTPTPPNTDIQQVLDLVTAKNNQKNNEVANTPVAILNPARHQPIDTHIGRNLNPVPARAPRPALVVPAPAPPPAPVAPAPALPAPPAVPVVIPPAMAVTAEELATALTDALTNRPGNPNTRDCPTFNPVSDNVVSFCKRFERFSDLNNMAPDAAKK